MKLGPVGVNLGRGEVKEAVEIVTKTAKMLEVVRSYYSKVSTTLAPICFQHIHPNPINDCLSMIDYLS